MANSYFDDETTQDEERRNNAFAFLSCLRDVITIAKRSSQPVPYKVAKQMVYDQDPELFDSINKLLNSTNQSDEVKYWIQRANLVSKERGYEVKPEHLIQQALNEEKTLYELANRDASFIQTKIWKLESALEYFLPEDVSENSILNHDFSLPIAHEYFDKIIYKDEKVKDYKLTDNRVLRLRLLHPDKGEKVFGADLVYEQFNLKTERVRFIHLQYKIWNTKELYFSQGNLHDQINKMDQNLCQSHYCSSNDGSIYSKNYRFPYCAAFIRPTTEKTRPDAKLKSTGYHIPICMIKKIQNEGNKKIDLDNIRNRFIGSKIFEDLFIANSIGSRWIPIPELEKFYREKGLNSDTSRLRVHAQEVIKQTEAEKNLSERF